jgi:hypothetical protein
MQSSHSEATAECRTDDDCTLMPAAITCCGECEPVPPFEPVPRTAVDSVLLELETRCAERPGPCDPPVCEKSPPGCQADAICHAGRCLVVQSGACSGLLALCDGP